jgi:hypothetical protein
LWRRTCSNCPGVERSWRKSLSRGSNLLRRVGLSGEILHRIDRQRKSTGRSGLNPSCEPILVLDDGHPHRLGRGGIEIETSLRCPMNPPTRQLPVRPKWGGGLLLHRHNTPALAACCGLFLLQRSHHSFMPHLCPLEDTEYMAEDQIISMHSGNSS